MKMAGARTNGRRTALMIIAAVSAVCVVAGIAHSQASRRSRDTSAESADAEFQMARVIYKTYGGAGSHGLIQPWWAIDYPYAEDHFFAALRRLTNISVAGDEPHLELTDNRIFQYPFL